MLLQAVMPSLLQAMQAFQVMSLLCIVLMYVFSLAYLIGGSAFSHFKDFHAHSSITVANILGSLSSRTKNCSYKLDRGEETLQRKQN